MARRPLRSISVAAMVALLLTFAAPAHAASEQGTVYCGLSFHAGVRSETTGLTYHYTPLGVVRGIWNNSVLQTRTSYSGLTGTQTWKASTDGYLYGPGTYGFCY